MEINTLKTKNNFHNYVSIKQIDNTSPIELLLCGSDGSQLTNLNTTCTVTLLDTVDNQIRQKSTETIVGGLLKFKVKNALKANNHNLEVTLSDGSKYPSDGDFTILVSKSHTDRELEIINTMTYDDAVKKLAENVVTDFVEEKFNNLSSEGQSNAEVVVARNGMPTLNNRLNKIEEKLTVSANDFGASPGVSWQVNRDAIQAANDKVFAAGGGAITLNPGVYNVKGIIFDSHVQLIAPGVTLRHPDGLGEGIARNRTFETTGTIGVAKNILTVTDATGIEEGTIIAIRGAGGILESQRTKITSAVNSEQATGFVLSEIKGFLNNGYLQIGTEIIKYTGINGNELTGVTRGLYGTKTTSYDVGTEIGLVSRHYAEVKKVEGNTLTLRENVVLPVANAEVTAGTVGTAVRNIKFDGNRVFGGAPSEVHPLKLELTRYAVVEDVTFKNGEAGLMARNGNRDLRVDRPIFIDCSVAEKSFGAGGWLFRANQRCHYRDVTCIGNMWVGIYFDDRTSIGSEWDGVNIDCTLDGFNINMDRLSVNVGVANVGGLRCSVQNGKINGPRTGITCTSNSQGTGYSFKSTDNTYANIDMSNIYQPGIIDAVRTKLRFVTFDEGTTQNRQFVDSSTDTVYMMSGGSNSRLLFNDGSYNSPAMAFSNDPTTGFYRIADGAIQAVSKSALIQRIVSGGVMMAEGKDFIFGGTTGTKIGTSPEQKLSFYGAAPIVQPAKIGTIVSSASQAEVITQLNQVIVAMRNLGLVSNI